MALGGNLLSASYRRPMRAELQVARTGSMVPIARRGDVEDTADLFGSGLFVTLVYEGIQDLRSSACRAVC